MKDRCSVELSCETEKGIKHTTWTGYKIRETGLYSFPGMI